MEIDLVLYDVGRDRIEVLEYWSDQSSGVWCGVFFHRITLEEMLCIGWHVIGML